MKKFYLLFSLIISLSGFNSHAQDCEASFFYENVLNSVTFYNSTTYNYIGAIWNFGDGTPPVSNPGIAVPHVYASSGVYNVCLTISDQNCSNTFCDTVYVCGYLSNFSYTVSGLAVAFNNLSTGNYTKTIWDFGDGTTSLEANPVKAYAEPGLYDVCLILANDDFSCTQIYCESVAISTSANCINTAQINPNNNCNNDWNPVCGCNNVTYSNPCKAYYQGGITSWTQGTCSGACIAAFGSSIDLYTVSFNNFSVGGFSAVQWNFGDGNYSNENNPVHTYSSAGTYTVCLQISGNGCSDTQCQTIEITGTPECHAQFTFAQSCDEITFTQNSGGAYSIVSWQLGDGSIANTNTVIKTYTTPGAYDVCLTISGSGCQDTYCKLINIPDKDQIKAGINAQYTHSPLPVTVQFQAIDSFNNAFSYLWDFGDGDYSSEKSTSHTFTTNCTPTVCLTIKDVYNCSDTKCKTLSLCTSGMNNFISPQLPVTIFPNPAKDIVNVRAIHSDLNQVSIIITSVSGNVLNEVHADHIVQGNMLTLPFTDYSAGMYLIHIVSDELAYHQIVVKH